MADATFKRQFIESAVNTVARIGVCIERKY